MRSNNYCCSPKEELHNLVYNTPSCYALFGSRKFRLCNCNSCEIREHNRFSGILLRVKLRICSPLSMFSVLLEFTRVLFARLKMSSCFFLNYSLPSCKFSLTISVLICLLSFSKQSENQKSRFRISRKFQNYSRIFAINIFTLLSVKITPHSTPYLLRV